MTGEEILNLNSADILHLSSWSEKPKTKNERRGYTSPVILSGEPIRGVLWFMFISPIKRNVIYSLISFGSESKPKVPRGTSCTAGRPSSVGSFQPNVRLRFDIFRLDVIFAEWRSVWFISILNQRSAEKIRSDFVTRALVVRSSLLGFRLRGRWRKS